MGKVVKESGQRMVFATAKCGLDFSVDNIFAGEEGDL